MMINKKLINTVPECKKYIVANILFQWLSLIANVVMMWAITAFLTKLYNKNIIHTDYIKLGIVVFICIAVRFAGAIFSNRMSFMSSASVKKVFREKIYEKLLRLGASYDEQVNSSEILQVAVEGVDQLETYFGAYLPQFFYSMLAPVTLFIVLANVYLPVAIVLLICVPLIPVTIIIIQKWAKKLLSKYWGEYTALGDTFLENLQGITTLKIYEADGYKHEKMNEQSERFRKITMKVLTMQLNSITVMDIIAYGGAAIGIIMSVNAFVNQRIDLGGGLLIILLAADFFLPMRLLGSYFHIAMNGMAASDKIFRLLELEEGKENLGKEAMPGNIELKNIDFAYEQDRSILKNVDMTFTQGSLTAIVGESGSGKSTIASLIMGRNTGFVGDIVIGGVGLKDIDRASLMKHITYVSHNSYLFTGTVRDNLLMGKSDATDKELCKALERVNLLEYLNTKEGLDTKVLEKGSNFSGGQCQRLAMARALLKDSKVYIFDEATSNIDVESENDIMEQILLLAKEKTVILISHRLANVVEAHRIYTLEAGVVMEYGKHEELLETGKVYSRLWKAQQELENIGKES